jgi:methionyl-tRNA formyltransferase
MNLCILTTETLHHAFFVQEIARRCPRLTVLLETQAARAPFPVAHPFEAARDEYERQCFFAGAPPAMGALAPTRAFTSANHPEAVAAICDLAPDVGIVFGTGLLRAPLLQAFRGPLLNLHGGDPEEYRGLDTHLWAIYHQDWGALATTLHHIDGELDTGDIVQQADVPLARGLKLHELRAANTRVCLDLCTAALAALASTGRIPARRQRRRGRYYSFMPADLKAICQRRFERHTGALP